MIRYKVPTCFCSGTQCLCGAFPIQPRPLRYKYVPKEVACGAPSIMNDLPGAIYFDRYKQLHDSNAIGNQFCQREKGHGGNHAYFRRWGAPYTFMGEEAEWEQNKNLTHSESPEVTHKR